MTLTRVIVTEFIQHYMHKCTDDQNGSSRKRKRNGENDEIKISVKCTRQEGKQTRRVLPSLIRIADEFEKFLDDSSERGERFAKLTSPLVPLLMDEDANQQDYLDAFKVVANELFSRDITWGRIVTFLVYCGELAVKVAKQTKDDDDKMTSIVSQIVQSVCIYFEEQLMQWIVQQDGGWLNVITFEDEIKSESSNLHLANSSHSTTNNSNENGKSIRHVVGVVALAAIIGGVYICSKLSVQ